MSDDIEMKDSVDTNTEAKDLTEAKDEPTTNIQQDETEQPNDENDTDKEQPVQVKTEENDSVTTPQPIQQTTNVQNPAQSQPQPSIQDDIDDVDEEIQIEPQPQVQANEEEEEVEDPLRPIIHPIPLQRKDKSLKELLNSMDEYAPIIPDAVTDYYLAKAGFETTDKRIKRLLALATQKFISDIASDAYQYSRIRSTTSVSNSSNPQARARALLAGMSGSASQPGAAPTTAGAPGPPGAGNQGKLVLTMEDLGNALGEYGLNTKTPDFYR